MRFLKILLVCLVFVLFSGLRGNHVSGKAGAANPLLQRAILADGDEPLPRPPLVADGGEPLPRPPLTVDGGEPLPHGGWRRTAAEATAGDHLGGIGR